MDTTKRLKPTEITEEGFYWARDTAGDEWEVVQVINHGMWGWIALSTGTENDHSVNIFDEYCGPLEPPR
jgi:hypothetical protein